MCSGSGKVQKDAQALQDAQLAMTKTLNADYSTTFAEQQSVAKAQIAKANALMANPLGYSPQELATAKTSINENTATAARQAIGAAGAFAASHGGADIGNGAMGQIAGEIGSAATNSKARSLAELSNANEGMKRQSFFAGLGELNNAGADLGNVGQTAIGSSSGVANSSTGAGDLSLKAGQSTMADITGLIGAGAGMVKAISGIPGLGGSPPAPSDGGNYAGV